jgi:hypothetical protein
MPSSGPLNMGGTASPVSVAKELGLSLTATITMNDAAVRTLAGVGGSGTQWSMNSLYGKSKPLPAIGAAYEGGFFAGQIGVAGVPTYNIVVGPLSTAESSGQWKTSNSSTTGTDSVIDGPANTAAMIAAGAANHPCGQFCDNLTVGGYTDWYMPAKNELEICFFNLKPGTHPFNSTSSGANVNAVPSRPGNYSYGVPGQTSAAAFQAGGAQAFDITPFSDRYWSSTQNGATSANNQRFYDGLQQNGTYKIATCFVRAVRRVAA